MSSGFCGKLAEVLSAPGRSWCYKSRWRSGPVRAAGLGLRLYEKSPRGAGHSPCRRALDFGATSCYTKLREPKWWNWQTRGVQGAVGNSSCGFKSHLRHQILSGWRNWQTHTFEGRMRQLVGVRVPLPTPFSNAAAHEVRGMIVLRIKRRTSRLLGALRELCGEARML
jgi:hypothetical protein